MPLDHFSIIGIAGRQESVSITVNGMPDIRNSFLYGRIYPLCKCTVAGIKDGHRNGIEHMALGGWYYLPMSHRLVKEQPVGLLLLNCVRYKNIGWILP